MSTTRITGKVKWFNSKAGYGFITACEGELVDNDIFVHYSSIKADSSHYKYLTQGEYVDFSLTKPANEKHEYHAVDVTGVKGGLILCETRRLIALSSKLVDDEREVVESEPVEIVRKPRAKSAPPLKTKPLAETEGFTTVKKRGPARVKKVSA